MFIHTQIIRHTIFWKFRKEEHQIFLMLCFTRQCVFIYCPSAGRYFLQYEVPLWSKNDTLHLFAKLLRTQPKVLPNSIMLSLWGIRRVAIREKSPLLPWLHGPYSSIPVSMRTETCEARTFQWMNLLGIHSF